MNLRNRSLQYLTLALCLAAAGTALAQRGGPGGGGGRHGGMGGGPMGPGIGGPGGSRGGFGGPGFGGMGHDFPSRTTNRPEQTRPDQTTSAGTTRGTLQVGPAGRWWDDKHFAKDLNLRKDQQKRMDAIFEKNRSALLANYEALKKEEGHLDELTHAKTVDETAVNAQIDRVSQARAALAKANTHFQYQIRSEMDADQIDRLETHRQ